MYRICPRARLSQRAPSTMAKEAWRTWRSRLSSPLMMSPLCQEHIDTSAISSSTIAGEQKVPIEMVGSDTDGMCELLQNRALSLVQPPIKQPPAASAPAPTLVAATPPAISSAATLGSLSMTRLAEVKEKSPVPATASPFSAKSWALDSENKAAGDVAEVSKSQSLGNNIFQDLCEDIMETSRVFGAAAVSSLLMDHDVNQTLPFDPSSNAALQVFDKMTTRGHQENLALPRDNQSSQVTKITKPEWAAIVGKPFSPSKLDYVPHVRTNQGSKLKLPSGLTQLGEAKWLNSLVGYFLEKNLPFSIVKAQTNQLWNKFGLVDTLSSDKGIFIFKFQNDLGCRNVLNRGPWMVGGQPMRLQQWSKELDISKNNFKSTEIWTKLYNIPLVYWTKEGLSAIASWLGKPIVLDELTEKTQRLTYARVCIDIPIESTFPSSFTVESDIGDDFDVRVEYSWIPRKCPICNTFGHTRTSCPKAVWRPKVPTEKIPKPIDTNFAVSPKRTVMGDSIGDSIGKATEGDSSAMWITVSSTSTPGFSHSQTPTRAPLDITNSFNILEKQDMQTNSLPATTSEDGSNTEASQMDSGSPFEDVMAPQSTHEASASPAATLLSKRVKIVDEVEAKKKKSKNGSKGKTGSKAKHKPWVKL